MSGRGRESIHEREAGGKRKKGEGKKGKERRKTVHKDPKRGKEEG